MAKHVMKNQHFHRSEEQYLQGIEKLLNNGIETQQINGSDKICIERFLSTIENTAGGSRMYKVVNSLILSREFFPPFIECTTDDFIDGCKKIKTARDEHTIGCEKQRFAEATIHDKTKLMKSFMLYLCNESERAKKLEKNGKSHWLQNITGGLNLDLDKDEISSYKCPGCGRSTKSTKDVFTVDEIERIIDGTISSRDRAMVTLLYESGCRCSELGSLTWGDLDDECKILTTDGKTSKIRQIPIVLSRKALNQWKHDYPTKITPDSFVFISSRATEKDGIIYGPMSYAGMRKVFVKAAKRGNVTRKIKLHDFRHTRITNLLKDGFSTAEISLLMWGSVHSDQLETYGHMSGSDLSTKFAEYYGLTDEETERLKSRPRDVSLVKCPNCGALSISGTSYCYDCGRPLSIEKKKIENERLKDIDNRFKKDLNFVLRVQDRMQKKP